MTQRIAALALVSTMLAAGCQASMTGSVSPGASTSPGPKGTATPAATASPAGSPAPTASASPAASMAANWLKIDGKEAKIGSGGKVTQSVLAGVIANITFGGLPDGTPAGAQPGEFIGMVQFGGDLKGDLTLDKLKEVNFLVQEVDAEFKTGKRTWQVNYLKDTFNTPNGPKLEIAGKDGVFTLVKASGKLQPDKGQPNLAVTNEIQAEFSFTGIAK